MTTTRRTMLRMTAALVVPLAVLFSIPGQSAVGGASPAGTANGGGTILFSRNHHWYTIAPNGTHRHMLLSITAGCRDLGCAAFSPEGERITVGADTANKTRVATAIVHTSGSGYHGVVNGLIAYTEHRSGNVYSANPDGTHVRLLVKNTSNGYWSHDGKRTALGVGISGGRIGTATVSADGRHYKLLTIQDRTLQAGCDVWSPDDRTLACEGWDDKHAGRNGVYRLSAADGGVPKRLTTNPLAPGHDLPGAYSPDGKWLVFARFDKNGNGIGLYVVTAGGKSVHRITPAGTYLQDGNTGDWSPSGNLIIFSEHIGGTLMSAPGSIWVVGADGRHLRHIRVRLPGLGPCGAPGMGCHEPRWSPDGKKIIFIGASLQGTDVYVAHADGSRVKQVTHDGTADDPSWGTHPAWK